MAKRPWFPFYVGDWLGSTRIALMTAEEERGYLRLLCHQWADPTGSLPDDDGVLARLSLLGDAWANERSTNVRKAFVKHPDLDGRVCNLRLYSEWKKAEAKSEKAAQAGRKSGKARRLRGANKRSTNVERTYERNANKTRTSHSHSHNIEEDSKESSCSEPQAASEQPVMLFPIVGDGPKEWPLHQDKIDQYVESYPGIDVMAQCREARQWCIDNITRRKTYRGMLKFLNGWLSRAQNASKGVGYGTQRVGTSARIRRPASER